MVWKHAALFEKEGNRETWRRGAGAASGSSTSSRRAARLELCHVGLGHLRVRQIREARVADHVARCPRSRGSQGQLSRGSSSASAHCDHDELALVRPAVPLQEDAGDSGAQQPQLRAHGGHAVEGKELRVSELVTVAADHCRRHSSAAVKVQSRLLQPAGPRRPCSLPESALLFAASAAAMLKAVACPGPRPNGTPPAPR